MTRSLSIIAALALTACASAPTASITDGKIDRITSAEAVTLVKQETRLRKVAEAQKNAKPIFELKAQPGQTIQLTGVESITVNVPQDLGILMAEQADSVSEGVQLFREARGIFRETVVPLGLGGMALSDRNNGRASAERINVSNNATAERINAANNATATATAAAQTEQTNALIEAIIAKPEVPAAAVEAPAAAVEAPVE